MECPFKFLQHFIGYVLPSSSISNDSITCAKNDKNEKTRGENEKIN
jgi:hypothetical protein